MREVIAEYLTTTLNICHVLLCSGINFHQA